MQLAVASLLFSVRNIRSKKLQTAHSNLQTELAYIEKSGDMLTFAYLSQ